MAYTETCAHSSTKWEHSGYPNPADCSRCLCPNGVGGRLCDRNAEPVSECGRRAHTHTHHSHADAHCGGVLTADAVEYKTVQSPGYPNPGYQPDQKCSWILKV